MILLTKFYGVLTKSKTHFYLLIKKMYRMSHLMTELIEERQKDKI